MNEQWHRRLISGELRGPQALATRFGLTCLAIGYRLAIWARNRAFDWGIIRTERVMLPVISLGNLTTGGTGKTPLAAYIARWFREHNVRVAILSRGYGAEPGRVNDEALVLEQLCPDVPHLQGADRVYSARIAADELESQLLLLDDGFQHRRLGRNLDIVLIDATNPWGYGRMLPRGLLREPLSSLRRADLICLTRVDLVAPAVLVSIRTTLQHWNPQARLCETRFVSPGLINAEGERADWSQIPREGAVGFCGIGNPASFRQTLASQQITLSDSAWREFPDHHNYTPTDVHELQKWCREHQATVACCTQKDLVKLQVTHLGDTPLWAVEQGVEVTAGHAHLQSAFEQILQQIPNDPDEYFEG